MKWILGFVVAAVAVCAGGVVALQPEKEQQQQEVHTEPTLIASLGWERGYTFTPPPTHVIVAVWDDGVVVWNSTPHGGPTYYFSTVSKEALARLKDQTNKLDLRGVRGRHHAPPDSSCFRLRFVSAHEQLPIRLSISHSGFLSGTDSKFIEAWWIVSTELQQIRPGVGTRLLDSEEMQERFKETFPGLELGS
ncbi:MAG: hypothetical protein H6815_12545 [Phycisphaeraceae bacterium]|nr:hypothetical protein [Phycisphaerales bacterium]MCB9861270.1 hypothetical protein [Phycisphaeraceae bacterium]